MTGPGVTLAKRLNITGAATKELISRELVLTGLGFWAGTGNIQTVGAAVIRIEGAGAILTILNNATILKDPNPKNFTARVFVENGGIITKLFPLGPTVFQIPVFTLPNLPGGAGFIGTPGKIIDPFSLLAFGGGLNLVIPPA